jgi:hypothetical protein
MERVSPEKIKQVVNAPQTSPEDGKKLQKIWEENRISTSNASYKDCWKQSPSWRPGFVHNKTVCCKPTHQLPYAIKCNGWKHVAAEYPSLVACCRHESK